MTHCSQHGKFKYFPGPPVSVPSDVKTGGSFVVLFPIVWEQEAVLHKYTSSRKKMSHLYYVSC